MFPSIQRIDLDGGKAVIVVETARGTQRPYRVRGQAYARVGAVTRKLDTAAADRMLLAAE